MYSVRGLVSEAFYMSLYDEEFQPDIPPGQMNIGLKALNYLLDEWRDKIPYTFTNRYSNVDDLMNTQYVQVDVVSFIINDFKQVLRRCSYTEWEQLTTITDLSGYPCIYWFDESVQTINIYPTPTQPNYIFEVLGRMALGAVTLNDYLPADMPVFMQSACLYELAFRLAGKFSVDWDEKKLKTYNDTMMGMLNKRIIDTKAPIKRVIPNEGSGETPGYPYWYFMSGGQGG
jgi:hypothetical protein